MKYKQWNLSPAPGVDALRRAIAALPAAVARAAWPPLPEREKPLPATMQGALALP